MANILMDANTASPGSWTQFLREFVDEDERLDAQQAKEQAELDEFRDELLPKDEDTADEDGGPGLGDRARDAASALVPREAVSRLAGLPTPGGLGLVILAILFFLAVIVPANASGATRIALMWQALTGGITIPPGPRKLHAQQAQQSAAANVAAGVASIAETAFADTLSALDTFWTDHVIG